MPGDKEEKGFVIKDRRFFDESGELRDDEGTDRPKEKGASSPGESIESSSPKNTEREAVAENHEDYILPEVNFTSFILSLHTSVLFHFGDFADSSADGPKTNLSAAKHTIDIIAMLKEKTAGNLSEDEEGLIEGILYELRMRYVKEVKK
ncbi:MAG: DUF1844 domain-containing protein [Deltaproteobacteria bacterium]|nr:DUF1844 domain-containing protein [Deltaproteobacteria bacterium]